MLDNLIYFYFFISWISFQNIQNISVFNMLGQEVMRRTNINAQTRELDLSALQSGAYFVQVSINNTVETLKILKK